MKKLLGEKQEEIFKASLQEGIAFPSPIIVEWKRTLSKFSKMLNLVNLCILESIS